MRFRSIAAGAMSLCVLVGATGCGVNATDQIVASGPTDQTTAIEGGGSTTASDSTTIFEPPMPTTTRPMFGGEDDNDDVERPTEAEIAAEIEVVLGAQADDPAVTPIIDCLAREFYDSELPNAVLRKIVAGEDAEVDIANEDRYNQITEDIEATCTGADDN